MDASLAPIYSGGDIAILRARLKLWKGWSDSVIFKMKKSHLSRNKNTLAIRFDVHVHLMTHRRLSGPNGDLRLVRMVFVSITTKSDTAGCNGSTWQHQLRFSCHYGADQIAFVSARGGDTGGQS